MDYFSEWRARITKAEAERWNALNALNSIIRHWDEFGTEAQLEETIENARKALPGSRPQDDALREEIGKLVAAKYEIHGYLSRLLLSCAPQCEPADNTLHLCTQIDNLIAGYRIRLGEMPT